MQHSLTTKEKAANLYLDQLETNSMYFAEIKVLQLATDCKLRHQICNVGEVNNYIFECIICRLPENVKKNRYTDVLCLEETRVKLSNLDGQTASLS